FVVLRPDYELNEAVGLTHRAGFAERGEWEFTDLVFDARFFRGAFGQARAGDLRLAIRAARNVIVIEWLRMMSGDLLGRDDAFMRRHMGECRRTGDVPDRINAVH